MPHPHGQPKLRLSLSGELPPATLAPRFDGVGLIRGEYILRRAEEYVTLPSACERLHEYTAAVARMFAPKPVWYRTSELTTPEANTLVGIDHLIEEADPMKGLRGLRRALVYPNAFLQEVRAVAEAARQYANLHLLLPYVVDAADFATGMELAVRAGWPNRIGAMLEIPAAVLDARAIVAAGATNVMVGMNDLTSLMTGRARSDRNDDKEHAAVWWCIERVRDAVAGGEWGVAGNLSRTVIERAGAARVPYVSLHYSQLPELLGVAKAELPDYYYVNSTKIKTRSRIWQRETEDTISACGLEPPWAVRKSG